MKKLWAKYHTMLKSMRQSPTANKHVRALPPSCTNTINIHWIMFPPRTTPPPKAIQPPMSSPLLKPQQTT